MRAPLSCSVALAGILLGLTACGGDDDMASGTSAKTPEGAKATLVAFADAFADGDGKRACALIIPEVRKKADASGMSCEDSVARVKTILSPDDVKKFKAAGAAAKPTVSGDTASLPGRGVVLTYRDGGWLVTDAGIASGTTG